MTDRLYLSTQELQQSTDWPWLHWSITGPGEVWHLKRLVTLDAVDFSDGRCIPIGSILERWDEPDYPTPCEILWSAVLRGEWAMVPLWQPEEMVVVPREDFWDLLAACEAMAEGLVERYTDESRD